MKKYIFLVIFSILLLLPSVSALFETANQTWSIQASLNSLDEKGMAINVVSNYSKVYVENVTKDSSCTASQVRLCSDTHCNNILAVAAFLGDVATFAPTPGLATGGIYYLLVEETLITHVIGNLDVNYAFPPNNNHIKFDSSVNNGHQDFNYWVDIRKVTVSFLNNPFVTLISPNDDSSSNSDSRFFNASITPDNFNSLKNATVYIWYENGSLFNKTTNIISGLTINYTTWNVSLIPGGVFNWNVLGCSNSTEGGCVFSDSNFTFYILPFNINSQSYNYLTYETSSENFMINITTAKNIVSVQSFLNYNGTRYPADTSCNSGECIITKTIDIPLVYSGNSQNKSFYWTINVYDGTTLSVYNTDSTENQQNVTKIFFQYCDATAAILSMNFTSYDEQNKSRVSPFNFEASFDTYIGSGSVKRSYNYTNNNAISVPMCIKSDINQKIDGIIAYSSVPNYTVEYDTRNYFFQARPVNSTVQNIPLYLLKASSSTSFILQVQNQALLSLKGVLVEAQRCYPGINTNETVFVSRTDSSGLTTGNFEAETALYQFFITNYSSTLLAVTPCSKVIPQTVPYTLLFQLGGAYASPFLNIQNISGVTSTMYFNSTTNVFTWTYIDTSSNFVNASLIIKSLNYTGNYQPIVCSRSSILAASILSCNLSDTGTYVADLYIFRTTQVLIDQTVFTISDFASIAGNYGIFLGFFIILICAFAFKWNEIAGIWIVTVGVIFVNLVGLVNFGNVFITAMVCIVVVITAILER